jgi:hypothetical protein
MYIFLIRWLVKFRVKSVKQIIIWNEVPAIFLKFTTMQTRTTRNKEDAKWVNLRKLAIGGPFSIHVKSGLMKARSRFWASCIIWGLQPAAVFSLITDHYGKNFFIFNLSWFCKNIWSGTNLAKIYIWHRGPWRQGHNAVGRGARCQQEWVLSRNTKGHDVKSLTPWSAELGAQCLASACRWGNAATHDGMYSLPSWAATLGFFYLF